MRRKRERRRGVVPSWVEEGEGWCHREEEEGEGRGVVPSWVEEEERERGGATVRRKKERGRLFSICEITTCLIRGSMG